MDKKYPDKHIRIELMRNRLNELVELYPRTHPMVINLSQQLDQLLNEAQQEMQKCRRRKRR